MYPIPQKLVLYLIKPSKYDDSGYVIRHWRGVLPSNTLSTLYSLTEDVRQRKALGETEIETYLLDDTVQNIPVKKICRKDKPPRVKVVVMLAGVQTNQFPRAAELARQFRAGGVETWVGGFHVSGAMAMAKETPPEIQDLLDLGVTIVKGEVEQRWETLLQDIVEGKSQPVYDFLGAPPELTCSPLPQPDPRYSRHFAANWMGTLDTSRGCPFNCSFCCIINVQGRRMRCRDPQALLDHVRENYQKYGIRYYFFTDDNFSRNKHWEAILDGLICLKEEEGLPFSFMMQCDVLAYRIPNFVEKAARAGCSQVFLGIESLNPENLKAAEKNQNSLERFQELSAAWHAQGVSTHAAYIIGFPHDTPESVRQDLRLLMEDLKPEQVSFFMLGPVPGSRDHRRLVEQGVEIDADYNRYDSFHPAMPHPKMSAKEWYALYQEAWRTFYSFENMSAILSRVPPKKYWTVFRNFIWIKHAVEVEGEHPMITGFWRIKDRRSRRPGFPVPGWWQHMASQLNEKVEMVRQWVGLFMEMEELWLQTRPPTRLEKQLIADLQRLKEREAEWVKSLKLPELPRLSELPQLPEINVVELRRSLNDWARIVLPAYLQRKREELDVSISSLPVSNLQLPRISLPDKWESIPSDVREWIVELDAYIRSVNISRRRLDWFWLQARHNLRSGKFWRISPGQFGANLVRDLALTIQFAWVLLKANGKQASKP